MTTWSCSETWIASTRARRLAMWSQRIPCRHLFIIISNFLHWSPYMLCFLNAKLVSKHFHWPISILFSMLAISQNTLLTTNSLFSLHLHAIAQELRSRPRERPHATCMLFWLLLHTIMARRIRPIPLAMSQGFSWSYARRRAKEILRCSSLILAITCHFQLEFLDRPLHNFCLCRGCKY